MILMRCLPYLHRTTQISKIVSISSPAMFRFGAGERRLFFFFVIAFITLFGNLLTIRSTIRQ